MSTTQTNSITHTTKTYSEVQDLFEDAVNVNPEDRDASGALLIYGSVQSFTPVAVSILEELTGLDLSTKEKLYDYLRANIELTDEFFVKSAGIQLMEAIAEQGGNPEDALNDLIKQAQERA